MDLGLLGLHRKGVLHGRGPVLLLQSKSCRSRPASRCLWPKFIDWGATLVFESTPLKSPLKLSLARVLVFENKHPSWGFS